MFFFYRSSRTVNWVDRQTCESRGLKKDDGGTGILLVSAALLYLFSMPTLYYHHKIFCQW